MNIIQEFSRFANLYDSYSVIQKDVSKRLINMITDSSGDNRYQRVLDIGSGSGSIYKEILNSSISFNEFIALDFSKEMLNLHPKSNNIKKLHLDFNSMDTFNHLKEMEYDLIVSSSALQWSQDLDMTLKEISSLSKISYLSLFTSNTFASIHKVANIKSPIYSKESIESIVKKYFRASFELVKYKLEFSTVYDMLKYIKRSGVSGGRGELSYKGVKSIIKNYPLNYLEFEVLFIKAYSKNYEL